MPSIPHGAGGVGDEAPLKKITLSIRGSHRSIQINTYETIKREISIQQDIYKKTILSSEYFFDGLCPCILSSYVPCSQPKTDFFRAVILSKKWTGDNIDEQKKAYIEVVNPVLYQNPAYASESLIEHDLSVIVMEFMDDYLTLNEIYKKENSFTKEQFDALIFALHILYNCGYWHGDTNSNTATTTIGGEVWKLLIVGRSTDGNAVPASPE